MSADLKKPANFDDATSTSSDIISSFISSSYFSLDLFFWERKGLTVHQNFLLSVIFFSFRFAKYSFFTFLRSDAQKFLCFVWANLFATVGFFKKVFFKRVLSIMDLENALVTKGLLFPRKYFFLWKDCYSHGGTFFYERIVIPTEVLFFSWSMMLKFIPA